MNLLEWLNDADREAFTAKLGHLFEHSPWVAAETWARRPFRDREQLEAELGATMRAADRARQLALIQAHPDLAGRLGQSLTPESANEQAGAGLNTLSREEVAAFQGLNAEYRDRFGFPFIICARLNNRATILAAMRARLRNDAEAEFQTALGEIEKIARLRLADVWARESPE
jgi:2-oxo-4-hydroxy-4-carboxy-5-ureidoimidazoline decarboxylase